MKSKKDEVVRHNLNLRQGKTFLFRFRVLDSAGVVIPWVDREPVAQWRDKNGCLVVDFSVAEGNVSFDGDFAELLLPSEETFDLDPGTLDWELWIKNTVSGELEPYIYGEVEIRRSIYKPVV